MRPLPLLSALAVTALTAGLAAGPVTPTSPAPVAEATRVEAAAAGDTHAGHAHDAQPAGDTVLPRAAAGDTTGPSPVIGTRRVAVIPMTFSASQKPLMSASQATAIMGDVAAFYRRVSGGRLTLNTTVTAPVVVEPGTTTCEPAERARWHNAATAQALGGEATAFQHIIVAWPRRAGCNADGWGSMPGRQVWINGDVSRHVWAHEVGHNLGFGHASTRACVIGGRPTFFPTAAPAARCDGGEYGDPLSTMGGSSDRQALPVVSRAAVGWVDPARVVDAEPDVDLSTTLTKAGAAGGVHLVRVPRGDGSFLALEFQPRAAGGWVATSRGVAVRVATPGFRSLATTLVDAIGPGWGADWLRDNAENESAMRPGMALTDPVSGATISVGTVTATTAQVHVKWAPDVTAPTLPGRFTAKQPKGKPWVALEWDRPSDANGVAFFEVWRDGRLRHLVSPPMNGARRLDFDDDIRRGQAYAFAVVAVDGAGNRSPAATVRIKTAKAKKR